MQIFLNYAASIINNDVLKNNCKVVLPSRRAAVFFKNICWQIKDSIFSLDEFINHCYQPQGKIIDNVETILHFFDAYAEANIGTEISFDEFASWAYTAVEDFNSIDNALADSRDLFSYLNDTKAIDLWNPEQPDLTDVQKKYLAFFKSQFNNYSLLNSHLLSKSLAYVGMANKWLANNILDVVDTNKVFVVGFNAFSNAEKLMFKKLNDAKKLEFIWDTDAHYINDLNHEAGYYIRNNIQYFYEKSTTSFNRISNLLNVGDKSITLYGAAKQVPQAKLLNKILSDIKTENWSNTAIVLANENLLPVVLNSLPAHIQNINVSMSYTLRNSQTAQWILAYTNLFCSIKNEHETTKRPYYKTYVEFFSHSFIRNYFLKAYETDVQRWIDTIIRYNGPYLSFEQFFKLLELDENKLQALKLFFQLFEKPVAIFEVMLQFLKEYILLLLETETLLNEEISESILFVELIKQKLDENNRGNGFTFKTIKKFLEQSIRTLNLSYKGEPLMGLQIMGLLETRCLSFENVIVLGCNEGSLPKSNNSNSYVPFDVRRFFNLPLPSQSDNITAYNFYRLLQYPKNVHLVYDTDSDSLGGGEKSRFLSQLKQELINCKITEVVAIAGDLPTSVSNEITILKTPEILEQILNYLTNKGLTPTAINAYQSCDLKFYFKYIAKLKDVDEVDEFLGADILGKLAHRILELLYQPYVGKILTSAQVIEINKLLEITTERACRDIEIQNQIEDGKNLLVVNIAKQFVKNFLRAEYQHALVNEKNNRLLTILSLENELAGNIQLQHQSKTIDIKLTGFADRIDRVGDTIRIIDYKTGTVNERKLAVAEVSELFGNDEYDKALQLMHYAYLFQQQNSENKLIQSGIISFRNFKNGMLNLKLNGNEIIATENYQSYEHNLQLMIAEMLSIERTINQTANLDSCNLCGFAALCKRN